MSSVLHLYIYVIHPFPDILHHFLLHVFRQTCKSVHASQHRGSAKVKGLQVVCPVGSDAAESYHLVVYDASGRSVFQGVVVKG